jgi:endonuclease YncB( thermonuclease family)
MSVVSRILECRVIDGDSMEMLLDLGHYVRITVDGRVAGVDTPERGTEAGKAVKEWSILWIASLAKPNWVSESLDKYRRSLGTIQDGEHPDRDLAKELLKHKMAREYTGNARQPWGEEELELVRTTSIALIDLLKRENGK